MKFNSEELIEDLIQRTRVVKTQVENLKRLDIESLNWKASLDSWSVLETIEHLNRYSQFYLPEIRKQINHSKHPAKPEFKSGWLGNYFAKSMLPKPDLNKMKTFKNMNPNGSTLSRTILDIFLQDQDELIELLQKALAINLTKTTTGISISRWIKLRLGDTFRVVIYHNQRHMIQIKKTLRLQENASLT